MKPWFEREQEITEFKEPVAYKGLNISVTKTKVNPPYIATVKSPATGKEVMKTGGNTEQEALDSAKQAVDKREADAPNISAGGQTSLLFNTPSNDELLKDPTIYNDIYAKISKDSNGPTLVIGNELYGAADLAADGFRRSDRRNPKKATTDALPQVAVNASNKLLSQMGIKMNGRYTMDIEGKYRDENEHTVYPLQFQSSTIHAGDKERMNRPGLTIGTTREDIQPWFQREVEEAEIIKFPEPENKVLDMPSVASYPDFITGVADLKARRHKGDISQASHDKLYTDLIHRFMRKEDVESPWFLREAPEDDAIKNRVLTALNKKKAEDPIFDKVYKSIIGKQLDTRIQSYIASHKDADIGASEMAFLVKEIPQLGKTQDVKVFVKKWNQGEDFIDVQSLVPDSGMTAPAEIQSIVADGIPKALFQSLTRNQSQFTKSDAGPAEGALAIMSKEISYAKDGGDLLIAGKKVEVKSGGRGGKSGGGRLWGGEPIDHTEMTNILNKVKFQMKGKSISVLSGTRPIPDKFPGKAFMTACTKAWFGKAVPSVINSFGTPEFAVNWMNAVYEFYKSKAGHSGVLVVGVEKYLYAVNGAQMLNGNVMGNLGALYYPTSRQPRELAPQVRV